MVLVKQITPSPIKLSAMQKDFSQCSIQLNLLQVDSQASLLLFNGIETIEYL